MKVMLQAFGRRSIGGEDKPAGEPIPVKRAALQSVDLGPISPAAAAHIERLEAEIERLNAALAGRYKQPPVGYVRLKTLETETVSADRIRDWALKGRIKACQIGAQWWIDPESFAAWVRACNRRP
jgi:hypothetical protein